MRKCDLRIPAETLIDMLCTRTSNKNKLRQVPHLKSVDLASCRMCGETGKMISHIVSEC